MLIRGYRLDDYYINVRYYKYDVALIMQSEDDPQRPCISFVWKHESTVWKCRQRNANSIIVSKQPVRCKLEVEVRELSK